MKAEPSVPIPTLSPKATPSHAGRSSGLELRALFIPLKGEFFDAFKAGTKRNEYRAYGPRWNERTCTPGRLVTLSLGYGKASRLSGRVVSFTRHDGPPPAIRQAFAQCYGNRAPAVADIEIEVFPT